MRIKTTKSASAETWYVIKDVRINGKRTTKIIQRLGTLKELQKLHSDPYTWAKEYIKELNMKEKMYEKDVIVKYSQSNKIKKNIQSSFNGGYLFLQKIYHELDIHKICESISKKYRIQYNLDSILSRLIYSRILFPSSKLSTFDTSKKFIEKPDFELHHIYRSLEVISDESDFIQSQLYKNSLAVSKRNTDVLYYDCTNFFFEIEEEKGLRQYGRSKENRPNPIVQMGLFMDENGIPLAFGITKGNTNEQTTLKPLEQQIIKDFNLSKFVVCTDAGLSGTANRKFNAIQNRAFITAQSIKKLKKHLRQWSLDSKGWKLPEKKKIYDINNIDEDEYYDSTFYKEKWINEDGLEQRLVVTYSVKYRNYQRSIRERQIMRAEESIKNGSVKRKGKNQNDPQRFVDRTSVTEDGEIADKIIYSIDEKVVRREEEYDGFYAVCTTLEDKAEKIMEINKRRWQIEESFRIMKSEFRARPVYLQKDTRIEAHFLTCFISLLVYRLLEERLDSKFTSSEIISELRDMNFQKIAGEGYVPLYTRTDFTDRLHEIYEFNTDTEIVGLKKIKEIIKFTKS